MIQLHMKTSRCNLSCPNSGPDEKKVRNEVFDKARKIWQDGGYARKFRHYPKNWKPFYWQGMYDGTNIKEDGTAALNVHYIKHPMW